MLSLRERSGFATTALSLGVAIVVAWAAGCAAGPTSSVEPERADDSMAPATAAAAESRVRISFDLADLVDRPRITMVPAPARHAATWREWITTELEKYPSEVFPEDLPIYPGRALFVERVRASGTWWRNGIALAAWEPTEQMRSAVAIVLHHEIATWLGDNNWPPLDEESWFRCVPPSFQYSNNALEVAKNTSLKDEVDESLVSSGFLNRYCMTSFGNDFATIASYLFTNRSGFWEAVEEHDALRCKVSLVVEFFESLHPQFSEEYFRRLPRIHD